VQLYNDRVGSLQADDSCQVAAGVLKQAGVNAIHNLLSKENIKFLWNRTKPECQQTQRTTRNESMHRNFNCRLPRFGGVRTFATAQQYVTVIQYQHNYQKFHSSKDQYYVDIDPLPVDVTRQSYQSPLPLASSAILLHLTKEFAELQAQWTDAEIDSLQQCVVKLATGVEHCHTKDLCYWLSTHAQLNNKSTPQIACMLKRWHAEYRKQRATAATSTAQQ